MPDTIDIVRTDYGTIRYPTVVWVSHSTLQDIYEIQELYATTPRVSSQAELGPSGPRASMYERIAATYRALSEGTS